MIYIVIGGYLPSANSYAQFLDVVEFNRFSSSPTSGEKPQSKVWKLDNEWWAIIPDGTGSLIRRLDGTTWTKIFPRLSSSSTEKADTKVVGDKTYILLFNGTNSNLVTVTYDPGPPKIYSNPVTQSITLVGSSIETATIDIDGTGRMWLAYEGSNNINVMWSNSSPYDSWNGPLVLESGLFSDDICAVTAFNDDDDGEKIGVMWSNQNNERFGFRYRNDNDPVGTWSALEVASGSATGKVADDHINFAVDGDGTIYAAIKTSYDDGDKITIGLLERTSGGIWSLYNVTKDDATRPIALLDDTNNKIFVVYTACLTCASDIKYKWSTTTSTISFSAASTLASGIYNNATSTKETFNNEVTILY